MFHEVGFPKPHPHHGDRQMKACDISQVIIEFPPVCAFLTLADVGNLINDELLLCPSPRELKQFRGRRELLRKA